MHYCDRCLCITEGEFCPLCGNRNLTAVQASDFCFLTEQDDIWAELLIEILTDHGIEFIRQPVYDARVCAEAGNGEHQKLYVPYKKLLKAQKLMQEVLPSE